MAMCATDLTLSLSVLSDDAVLQINVKVFCTAGSSDFLEPLILPPKMHTAFLQS